MGLSEINIESREKIYSLVFPQGEASSLYFNMENTNVDQKRINCLTYFNLFSAIKWKRYTTLKSLYVEGTVRKECVIEIHGGNIKGLELVRKVTVSDTFLVELTNELQNYDFIGLVVTNIDSVEYIESMYYTGVFKDCNDVRIGIVICTFKREDYVRSTIDKILEYIQNNRNFELIVVDNGKTLLEEERDNFLVIHNINSGGSGGFTRGLMISEEHKNNYTIFMDDDIIIDTTTLERVNALLLGMKDEHKESSIGGAMLCLDHPIMQYEKAGVWNGIRVQSINRFLDVSKLKNVLLNEEEDERKQYSAWWFSVFPNRLLSKIGYPLPVFVKGDDIEYGMRNDKEIIHLNGVAVWHESFVNKESKMTEYFSQRNNLIVNMYTNKHDFFTLLCNVGGRVVKHLIYRNGRGMSMLGYALQDLLKGFDFITNGRANKQLERVFELKEQNIMLSLFQVIKYFSILIMSREKVANSYREFKDRHLKDTVFWEEYLRR